MSERFLLLDMYIWLLSMLGNNTVTSATDALEINRAFFDGLESVAQGKPEYAMSFLKAFVIANPEYEPAYLALWERYITAGEAETAQAFFDSLKHNPKAAGHCWWMIAKLWRLNPDKKPTSVRAAFLQALEYQENTSATLIYELCDFLYENGDSLNIANTLRFLPQDSHNRLLANAFLNIQQKNYEAANLLFEDLAQKIKPPLEMLRVWGYSCYQFGKRVTAGKAMTLAENIWQNGLEIAKREHHRHYQIAFLTHLAALANKTGNYIPATQLYSEAYEISVKIQDLKRQTIIYSGLSDLLADQEEYHSALAKLDDAIIVAKKLQDKEYLSKYYGKKARILEETGQFAKAFSVFRESERLALETRDQFRLSDIYLVRGDLYARLQYHNLAKKNYQAALRILAEVKEDVSQYVLRTKARLGHSDMAEKQYKAARIKYQNYITFLKKQAVYQKKAASWTMKLAETFEKTNDLQNAYRHYQEAESLAAVVGWVGGENECRIRMADIHLAKKEYGHAIHSLLAILDKMDVGLRWEANFLLGKAFQASGLPLKATAALRRAVDDIENFRDKIETTRLSVMFFSNRVNVYHHLVESYFNHFQETNEPVYLDSLLYFSELGRGRTLQELIASGDKNALTIEQEKAYQTHQLQGEELRRLQRKMRNFAMEKTFDAVAWDDMIAEWQLIRNSLVAQQLLLSHKKKIRKIAQKVNIPSLAEVSAYVKETQRGLVTYHISERSAFAFLILPEENRLVHLKDVQIDQLQKDIKKLVTPLHHITRQNFKRTPFYAGVAYSLYLQLVKALEDEVDLPDEWILVPNAELVNLPVEMLLTRAPEKQVYTPTSHAKQYADDFLQHRYMISYSPNITVTLASYYSKNWFEKEFLAVAHSFEENRALGVFPGGGIWRPSFLPFARDEVENIKKNHPDKTDVFIDKAATKANFFTHAKNYSILHLSTHGFLDREFDSFSGLALALGTDSLDDGYLMGYELMKQKLNCDLITLSACETARGKVVAGEGILGLPRLLIGTGVKSVMMTHWKINDHFSSVVMPEFYKQLFDNSLTKTEALARAKQEMLYRLHTDQEFYYQHPMFWACFTLFGDPGKISGGVKYHQYWMLSGISFTIIFTFFAWLFWLKRRKKSEKPVVEYSLT